MGHRGGFGHPHWPKGVAIYVLISSFFLNFFFLMRYMTRVKF
jgi:hypothetical protein